MVKTKKVVGVKNDNVKFIIKTTEYCDRRGTANEVEREANNFFDINEAKQALASLSEYLETLHI